MNSELIIAKERIEQLYPVLAKDPRSPLVVLFTSAKCGFVMVKNQTYAIGQHQDCWMPVYGSDWQILPPGSQVILTQK